MPTYTIIIVWLTTRINGVANMLKPTWQAAIWKSDISEDTLNKELSDCDQFDPPDDQFPEFYSYPFPNDMPLNVMKSMAVAKGQEQYKEDNTPAYNDPFDYNPEVNLSWNWTSNPAW